LREEMETFNKLVSVDLQASALVDAEDLEEEAVASMREEAFTQVRLEGRVGKLRERLASSTRAPPAADAIVGATGSSVVQEESDDDDDDDDDGGLSALDWRAKAF